MIAKQTVSLDARARAQGAAPRRAARGPRRRPARDGQLRHPRGPPRRGRRVIVLGIDPGTAALGYGIVERTGGSLREVDHGCLDHEPGPVAAGPAARDPRPRRGADRDPPARTSSPSSGCSSRRTPRPRSPSARRAAWCCSPRRRPASPSARRRRTRSRWRVTGYGSADKEQVARMVDGDPAAGRGPDAGRRRRRPGDRDLHRQRASGRPVASRRHRRGATAPILDRAAVEPDHARRDALRARRARGARRASEAAAARAARRSRGAWAAR